MCKRFFFQLQQNKDLKKMGCKAIVGVVLILLGVGCLVGGSILCWQSTVQSTCADWEQVTGYIGTQCRETQFSTCAGCAGLNGNATLVMNSYSSHSLLTVPTEFLVSKVYVLYDQSAVCSSAVSSRPSSSFSECSISCSWYCPPCSRSRGSNYRLGARCFVEKETLENETKKKKEREIQFFMFDPRD